MSNKNRLKHEFKQMCFRNREGSYSTQKKRLATLSRIADDLREKYPRLSIHSLGLRHIQHLVEQWNLRELDNGTMKNHMSAVRGWAQKVGKEEMVPSNGALGIGERKNPQIDKSVEFDRWDEVNDDLVRLSLQLQQQFGLRREESIKFMPSYADQGAFIRLKPSWTKGKRARDIPVRTEAQRELLDRVKQKVGNASLIPADKRYVNQMHTYESETKRLGFRGHGLRHAYAQQRYQELTGRMPSVKGGSTRRELSKQDRQADDEVRLLISEELGHSRVSVVAKYIGR